jgi:hypothetical protein
MGKRLSSISGIVDGVLNSLFRIFFELNNSEWHHEIETAIDEANLTGEPEDWQYVGSFVGELFAEFFNY